MSKLQKVTSKSDLQQIAEENDAQSIEDFKHKAGFGKGQYNTNIDPEDGTIVFTSVDPNSPGPKEFPTDYKTTVRL